MNKMECARSLGFWIRVTLLGMLCAVIIFDLSTLGVMFQFTVPTDYSIGLPFENQLVKNDNGKVARIPLLELVKSNYTAQDCPNGTVFIEDVIVPESFSVKDRKIPRIIHVTGKSRCVTPRISAQLDKWKFDNYSLFFHDDDAMSRFFYKRDWKELPQMERQLNCFRSMTAKADLWRYLILWEYGGIYHDLDSVPRSFHGETITPTQDAYFTVETLHVLSQYFMATAPRHPLMYYAAHYALWNYFWNPDVGTVRIPSTTGPKALHLGFEYFTKHSSKPVPPFEMGKPPAVTKGVYNGDYGFNVHVFGENGRDSDSIVMREALVRNAKKQEYEKMGMKHFFADRRPVRKSCVAVMIEQDMKEFLNTNKTDLSAFYL